GYASYCGKTLGEIRRPRLVHQSTRLMMSSVLENLVHDLPERSSLSLMQQKDLARRYLEEAGAHSLLESLDSPVISLSLQDQRLISIIRLSASGTRLLMLDEPTSGLPAGEEKLLLHYIRLQGVRRSILVTLHNQIQARAIAQKCALLAGGTICEEQEIESFFTQPNTKAAQSFVRTGSCSVPSPDADREYLSEDSAKPVEIPDEAKNYVSDCFGPRGFLWLIKGKLAGTPMPGIFYDAEYDLTALRKVGVTHLISLMEEAEPAYQLYSQFDIEGFWRPVPDMGAPDCETAKKICNEIDVILASGGCLALHCRAGMGRTGTMLAAYLIWKGEVAFSALETVRNVEPRWVQSQVQIDFLEEYYLYINQ
ncbi:MAG: dual specificity protein phosphatase family protein, partial [Oceanobacter sp.]